MILSSASGSKFSFYLKYTIDGEILHNNCKSVIDKYGNVVSFQQGLPILKCVEHLAEDCSLRIIPESSLHFQVL